MESNFEWITANGDIGIRFFHSIDDGGYSSPPHWHNDLEMIYILEGNLKVRFGDGGERLIGANELLIINSGTIHAVTAYPNQAIVLQVPYELLLQYIENYDQLYFVVDERPGSEKEKRKLSEFKAVLREMDLVYGAQKEGYQLKFDSLLLEALYRLQVDYAVRIGTEHIPQNQKAVHICCPVWMKKRSSRLFWTSSDRRGFMQDLSACRSTAVITPWKSTRPLQIRLQIRSWQPFLLTVTANMSFRC